MKLYCFSRRDARNFYVNEKHWSSLTLPDNVAIISIISTPQCQENILHSQEYHWFSERDNVLNLSFDDLPVEEWHDLRCISLEEAKRAAFFIYNNIGKDFYINCRAGKSRSQAFVRFILDVFPDLDYRTLKSNPPITPNIEVLSKLKQATREEYLDVWWDLRKSGLDVTRISGLKYKTKDGLDISYVPYTIEEDTGLYYPELFIPGDNSGKCFESPEELKDYLCRVKSL